MGSQAHAVVGEGTLRTSCLSWTTVRLLGLLRDLCVFRGLIGTLIADWRRYCTLSIDDNIENELNEFMLENSGVSREGGGGPSRLKDRGRVLSFASFFVCVCVCWCSFWCFAAETPVTLDYLSVFVPGVNDYASNSLVFNSIAFQLVSGIEFDGFIVLF